MQGCATNLVDAKSDLIKGRDTAMDKWNTEVATKRVTVKGSFDFGCLGQKCK